MTIILPFRVVSLGAISKMELSVIPEPKVSHNTPNFPTFYVPVAEV